MATSIDYLNQIKQIHDKLFTPEFRRLVDYELTYKIETLVKNYNQMFEVLSPFQIGDRVQLRESLTIPDSSHGWWSCRHFLVKGSVATVHAVDWDNRVKDFTYNLTFDNDSYIDSRTNEVIMTEPDRRFYFTLSSKWLEKIKIDLVPSNPSQP